MYTQWDKEREIQGHSRYLYAFKTRERREKKDFIPDVYL